MSLKKVAYLFLGLLGFNNIYGQVTLQSGSAVFSLPMFNWQDDKSRLTSIVALNYNSGNGLKVNDVASNVGQGWSLVTGGVISRMQVGEPDDQPKYDGNGTPEDITKYPAGYLYATIPAENGCPNALTKYPIYHNMNQLYAQHNLTGEDRQLDYFTFQFNGKTGMFILDTLKTGSDGIGIPLGDTKMRITFQRDNNLLNQGIRTNITSFIITDVDGLIYKFTKQGLTKVLQTSFCDPSFAYPKTQPNFKDNNVYYQSVFDNVTFRPWVINNWYLSEIEDGLTHRKIYFNYTVLSLTNPAGEDFTNNAGRKNYCIVTHKISVTQTPEISSIVYPDGHNVTFNYGAERSDYAGEKALSTVDITYNGRYISKYELNTTYFIGNRYGQPVSAYQKQIARLCLRSVKKYGVDLKEDNPPYLFDYYLNSGTTNDDDVVPAPFAYNKDIWGFYNGNNTIGYAAGSSAVKRRKPGDFWFSGDLSYNDVKGLCFIHEGVSGVYLNSKIKYAANGLLKQIIYPTGGTLTYEYEQNTGKLGSGGTDTNVGGVHVSMTKSTDGGYSNSCANPVTTSYHYVLSDGTSSMWGLEMPVNTSNYTSHYAPEKRQFKLLYCDWKYKYPGILNMNQAISLNTLQQILMAISPILNIVSVASTINDIINLCLLATTVNIVTVVIDAIAAIVSIAVTCFGSQSRDTYTTIYNNTDLNGVSPLPTQFKRVEVVEGSGGNGKTIQEFTSDADYPLWEQNNSLYTTKQRFAPWAYGLPKRTAIYNVTGNLLKESINQYNYGYAKTSITNVGYVWFPKASIDLSSCKCQVVKTSSQRNTDWASPTFYDDPGAYTVDAQSNPDLKAEIFKYYTGRVELSSTTEKIYNPNDDSKFVSTTTEYTYHCEGCTGFVYSYSDPNYGSQNYEVANIKTTQSNGDIDTKYFTYSSDYYYEGGIFNTLGQKNIIGLPVSTESTVKKAGSSTISMLSEKVTELVQLSNGDIKPSRTLEQRFNQPSGTAVQYSPTNPNNNTIYKTTQNFTYDANGNLTGLKDEGGRSVTNLYDYNDKYIVASVINADPATDKVAYTSFENAGQYGGWIVNGSSSYNSSLYATGSSSFILLPNSSNTLTANSLNTAKAYTMSYWSDNNSISVTTGAILNKTGPTYNGMTYYEYDINAGTASVVIKNTSTTTNANIDELRIYPKTSRMRTTTYDPLIGKTSECDENNRITYYTYDNLGRLQFIKDETRNVVKMYEYNNVSAAKQNGCPGTYSNKQISEIFIRSTGCATNTIGGEYTYTVPAGKYTSVISQEDADAQAQNEILSLGQSTADGSGPCLPIYYNDPLSQSFSTQTCDAGYTGGAVTYSVPANRYSSLINKADANQQAQDEIDANGQIYANTHPVCTYTTDPQWEWVEGAPSYCSSVNGQLPPHLFVQETDMNPHSSSYNQTSWVDIGPDDACPAGNYYNALRSQSFTKNNCSSGYTGSTVTYTVPAGKYSSTISQADADQQAINDVNVNGQNYANINGTCTAAATKPIITSTGWDGQRVIAVYFTVPSGCNTVIINYTDLNTGQTGSSGAGGCGSPRDVTVPTSYHTYRITVVSYLSTGSATSDPVDVYVPF